LIGTNRLVLSGSDKQRVQEGEPIGEDLIGTNRLVLSGSEEHPII
jgi:hypothetical protein